MNLHDTLTNLYEQMLPLCSGISNIARALAGLGALLYIAIHIWRTLADGERIEIFPILRPFGIGLLIAFFPTLVLGTMNGILGTITKGTEAMLDNETFSMAEFRKLQENTERTEYGKDPDTAYMESDEAFDAELESLGWSAEDMAQMAGMFFQLSTYSMQLGIRYVISEVMEFIFDSASLIIDTIRTFFLIVLSILGPISFALSIWNGMGSTIEYWITRYIQVYLWLPVSNIFSCILLHLQTIMVQNNIECDGSNWVYLLFLAIGSIGYFCVPTVSQWIVQASGVGSYVRKVNSSTVATMKSPVKLGSMVYHGIQNRNKKKAAKKKSNDTAKS